MIEVIGNNVKSCHVFLKNNMQNLVLKTNPAGIYLRKVNNRNTRTRCEICSMLTIKTPER